MEDCAIADGERTRALELAGLLDDFNNGVVGPGHCDDEEPGCDGELCQPPADEEPDCTTEICSGSDDDTTGDTTDEDATDDGERPPFG